MDAPVPDNENDRLKALYQYDILDTPPEEGFEDIIYLASEICETPIALISLIDEERQWFKARKGLEACETHRDFAFCAHAILKTEVMVVPDAQKDKRFRQNPLVTQDPYIRFYAGAPLITPAGHHLGTLCVIDQKPRQLNDFQLKSLQMLAKQVVKQLELRSRNRLLQEKFTFIHKQKEAIAAILEERDELILKLKNSNKVRERVLSIMAHDLRSPLSTLQLLLSFIGNNTQDLSRQKHNIKELSKSLSITTDLLDNLLAWGMSQIAGKQNHQTIELAPLAEEVMESLLNYARQKGNSLRNLVEPGIRLQADPIALKLILRNLLTNANKFTQSGAIWIEAVALEGKIKLSVCDTGVGMDAAQLKQLFSWDNKRVRKGTANEKGSGLGLPMCHDVLSQMGGEIEAESESGKGTKIYFSLPSKVKQETL